MQKCSLKLSAHLSITLSLPLFKKLDDGMGCFYANGIITSHFPFRLPLALFNAPFSCNATTFVTKRFDRYVSSQGNPLTRRHFASAMTMLEKTDSDPEPAGYLDIANVIEKICGHSATENLKELWRRIVFNILISNTDDHLRSHGFLLCKDDSWELSPAYDLNPSLEKDSLSLNIDFDNNDKDPELALSVCEMFRMSRTEAEKEVREMKSLIADNWRFIASENGISKREQDYMERCFLL